MPWCKTLDLWCQDSSLGVGFMVRTDWMFGQSEVLASGRSEDNAVRNSPGECRELAEGIGSLLGWRKGVHQKKIETRRRIIGG
ncbi:hypothetical protein B296_00006918 [Ensete ventricosum]|uniref:Uncharacterized protein n=1 Tax=Ensete ventricosum TaxID=4639 RepID=A0A426YA28_ENSVE|nr:hypothetical protein B296_00006918 [Ensete ventricosum]